MFDIYQVLWNSVVTQKFFIDARVGLNKIFFPTYLNGNDQTLAGLGDRHPHAQLHDGHRALARSLPGQRHGQYYVDEGSAAATRFKFGFDYAHSPVENRTTRFDDVDLTYSSTTGATLNVTLYGTPFYTKTAVDVTALYAQDSIAYKRLTLDRRPALGAPRTATCPSRAARPAGSSRTLPRTFPEQRRRRQLVRRSGRASARRTTRQATAARPSRSRSAATTT